MRAQAAFEFMLVVLLAMAFLIPAWIYITTIKIETTDELALSYAKNAVDKIASTADLVYSQGPPAKVKTSIYVPHGVSGFEMRNYTVIMAILYGNTLTDVFADSRAKLTNGTLPKAEGNYWMNIEAINDANFDINISIL